MDNTCDHLDKEDFGFSCQRETFVAFEGLHQVINGDHSVYPPYKPILPMGQNGAGETVVVSVVQFGGYKWRIQTVN